MRPNPFIVFATLFCIATLGASAQQTQTYQVKDVNGQPVIVTSTTDNTAKTITVTLLGQSKTFPLSDGFAPMHWMMGVLKVDKITFVASAAAQSPSVKAPLDDFLNLVRTGSPDQVQAAIDKGADVNDKDAAGKTALMYAAGDNPNVDVTAVLYNAGAKVGVKDDRGGTALMYAALAQRNDVMAAIVKDMQDGDKQTRGADDFYRLVQTGTPEQVQAAIAAGAKADDTVAHYGDDQNVTPVGLAARFNPNPGVFAVLTKAGARLAAAPGMLSPLATAAHYNSAAVVAALLQAGAPANGSDGVTALRLATQNPDFKSIMAVLVKADARFEFGGESALSSVATDATPDIIALMVASGAKVNFQDARGRTALMQAVWNADSQAVVLLLNAGTKIDLTDQDGRTALMIAAQGPHPAGYSPKADTSRQDAKTGLEIVRLLVRAGAKLDTQDTRGQTALIWAAEMQRPDVVKLLVTSGANKALKDSDGKSYVDYAQ